MTARKLLIFGVLSLWANGLLARSSRSAEDFLRDSLTAHIEQLPHDESRLDCLLQFTKDTQGNMERSAYFTDMLLLEAEEQQNDHYKCEAYFSQIFIAYNTYDAEGVQTAFKHLAPLARKEKYYDLLFRGWRCSIDFLILDQDYERNEREAQKMLLEAEQLNNMIGILEAQQCLANIYRATFRDEQAIERLEQALPIALQLGNNSMVINIWQPLLSLHESTRNYTAWHRNLREFDAYLHRPQAPETQLRQPILLILYSSYLNYYTLRGDMIRAEQYLKTATQHATTINSPLYKIRYHQACAAYYDTTKQNENAILHIREARRLLGNISQGADYHTLLYSEAGILYRMGRSKEALPLYKQVRQFEDSLQVATINKQYELLRKDFNTNALQLEQARLQHHVQLLTLLLLVIGLVGAAYFFVYLLKSRRFLQRAEHDMREMTHQMEQANEAKDRFLSNISTMISTPISTVVEGSLRLATEQITDTGERQQISSEIRKMSSSLLKVINNILDLSRLEAGMMKYDITAVNATDLLLGASSVSSTPHGVEIRYEWPEDTLFMVRADGDRLLQVFTSLFEQATAECDRILLTVRKKQGQLHLLVTGSALAPEHPLQEIIIRNEINRMLITHFDGSYEVHTNQTPGVVAITLPIVAIIAPEAGPQKR